MNIEDFRTYCLSLKGVSEKMPFDKATSEYDRNLIVFSVFDKWFCFVNIEQFDFCTLKCDPDEVRTLQENFDDIRPAYHMNKKHWISVRLNGDVSDEMVRRLLRQAYELVAGALPRKLQQLLAEMPENPELP